MKIFADLPPQYLVFAHISDPPSQIIAMGDDELAAIRAQRMAEMRAQGGGGGGAEQQKQMEERAKQMTDMKNGILSQVLDQKVGCCINCSDIFMTCCIKARARLNTLMLAKPEKGKQVEAMLCQMAQTGQLGGKLGDDELKGLLDRMTGGGQSSSKVKFDRRRAAMDSDDDDLDDL